MINDNINDNDNNNNDNNDYYYIYIYIYNYICLSPIYKIIPPPTPTITAPVRHIFWGGTCRSASWSPQHIPYRGLCSGAGGGNFGSQISTSTIRTKRDLVDMGSYLVDRVGVIQ